MIQIEQFIADQLQRADLSLEERQAVAEMQAEAQKRLPQTRQVTETAVPTFAFPDLDKQTDKLASLFAKELGMSREQYIDGLPRVDQPEGYKGRFDTALLVQTPTRKLSLARMLEIAGVVNYLELKDVKDWQKDPAKFKTPDKPYLTWLHDGSVNKNRSVQDVRATLQTDERGGTVFDGLALFIQNPDVLKDHYLDLPGSQYVSGYAPDLDFWSGRPGLDYYWIDYANPDWGSVVAGRDIVTK